MMIRIYPHHIMRENPLATGAGADRMSTGMKKSFGKTIGVAARVHKGQTLVTVNVNGLEQIPQSEEHVKQVSAPLQIISPQITIGAATPPSPPLIT